MLRESEFQILDQGIVEATNEWPDVATAVRALATAGPSVPAIDAVGYEEFCAALHDKIAPLDRPHVGVRITSEFGWITAQSLPA